jgi:bifunctional phosphoglucose/phosphomannose isomerase
MSSTDPMRGLVATFPEMLEAGWRAEPPDDFPLLPGRCWLLGGMGGSGMAAAVGALLLARDGHPALAWRNPELPGWLDGRDRVVVVSYSGKTWEAQAMIDTAIARSAPVRVVSSGGELAEACGVAKIPLFGVPGQMPPRAALPWLLAGVLRAVGSGDEAEIHASIAGLIDERDHPTPGRDPARIAAQMEGRLVVLLPVGPTMEVIAARWRAQILENAKQAALVVPLPEGCHNDIMGWQWLRDSRIPVSFFVLNDRSHAGGIWESILSALEEEVARAGHRMHRIAPHPAGGLGSLLADLYLADRVSVELAERAGVAATPVAAIERIRSAIRGQGSG